MCALWTHTKTAVNKGYGMINFGRVGLPNPFYKPQPWGLADDVIHSVHRRTEEEIHPELLMKPPYAQRTRGGCKTRGGKALLNKRLRQVYTNAALEGDGFFTDLIGNLGGTALQTIKRIALEKGASLSEILSDPEALLSKVKENGPKVLRGVRTLLSKLGIGKKKPPKRPSHQVAPALPPPLPPRDIPPPLPPRDLPRRRPRPDPDEDIPPPLPPRPSQKKPTDENFLSELLRKRQRIEPNSDIDEDVLAEARETSAARMQRKNEELSSRARPSGNWREAFQVNIDPEVGEEIARRHNDISSSLMQAMKDPRLAHLFLKNGSGLLRRTKRRGGRKLIRSYY